MTLDDPIGKAMQWVENPEKASLSTLDFSSGSRNRDAGRGRGWRRSEMFPRTELPVPRPDLGVFRH